MCKQARTWYYFTNEPNEEEAVDYIRSVFYRAPTAVIAGKVASGETLVALRFSIAVVPRVRVYKGELYKFYGYRTNLFDILLQMGFKLYYGDVSTTQKYIKPIQFDKGEFLNTFGMSIYLEK